MINTFDFLILWGLFILGSFFFLNYFAGESKVKTFAVFLLFLAILSVVYSSGITGHYIFHDDVYLWKWDKTNWATHPSYAQQAIFGRPLAALVMFSADSFVDSVKSANFVRFLTIVIISLIALGIDIWLRQVCGILRKASFLVSFAIVILPPFQMFVNDLSACYITVATLLSIFSALLLLGLDRNQKQHLNFMLFWEITKEPWFTVFLSLFFLSCSLMIYQSGATFFIALLAIWLIGVNCREMNNIKWPWFHLVVFFFATLIYLFLFKMLVPVDMRGIASAYSNSVTSDYAAKLWWFFRDPFFAALNLWHVFPTWTVAGGVLFIILLGFMLEFFSLMKSEGGNKRILALNFLLKYFAVLFLIFLSFSVNLVAQTNLFLYRTIAPLIAIVFVLFWSGIRRIMAAFLKGGRYETYAIIVLFFICVCGGSFAYTTFRKYCVDNNSRELRYIEDELTRKYNSNTREVYIIRPLARLSSQVPIADEFGVTTCFFPQDIPWLVKAAFQERRISLFGGVLLTSGISMPPSSQDPHLLAIDLNRSK